MSGNRSFERSMNGINNIEVNDIEFADGSTISSASSLVQLDTNNNFIGNNTFNVNLPTSSVNPNLVDINDNTILNKHAGDKLYSATDQNDFPTAFERNGTTGVITLRTEDTGTPLSGDTTITSITDAEISAIATNTADITTNTSNIATNTTAIGINTTAIGTNTSNIATNSTAIATNTSNIATNTSNIATNTSNIATNSTAIATNTSAIGSLTTATDPCFTTASINGQDLTLTPISGTSTIITIPSGGGGSSGAKAYWWAYDTIYNATSPGTNFTFGTTSVNVGNGYNGTTGYFTCPVGCAGKYYVSFNFKLSPGINGSTTIPQVGIFKTPPVPSVAQVKKGNLWVANPYTINTNLPSYPDNGAMYHTDCIIELDEGDRIHAQNVSTSTIYLWSQYNPLVNNFSGFWLGA